MDDGKILLRKYVGLKGKKHCHPYKVYGVTARGPYTTLTEGFLDGRFPIIIYVVAQTIRQAYSLAEQDVWSKDGSLQGIVKIYSDDGTDEDEPIDDSITEGDS